MKSSTADDLRNALTQLQDRAIVLQSLVDGLEPRRGHTLARWLPALPATMLSIVALAMTVYVATNAAAPAAYPEATANPKSLGNARLVSLFPDGRVEFSDPWSGTRLFQWDGTTWRTVSSPGMATAGIGRRTGAAVAADHTMAGRAQ